MPINSKEIGFTMSKKMAARIRQYAKEQDEDIEESIWDE